MNVGNLMSDSLLSNPANIWIHMLTTKLHYIDIDVKLSCIINAFAILSVSGIGSL